LHDVNVQHSRMGTMRGTVMYGPRDVRFEERPEPVIAEPTDAIIRLSATCICGSDLWPYRGANPITEPTPMGHEYCGVVEDVGRGVISIKNYRRTEQCKSAPWVKADWRYRRSDSVAWGSVSATALPPAGKKASRSFARARSNTSVCPKRACRRFVVRMLCNP